MADLTADTARTYEAGVEPVINDIIGLASTTFYEGTFCESDGSGLAQPYDGTGADSFVGIALRGSVTTASGGERVRVVSQGIVTMAVTGVVSTSINAPVYAADDGTLTTTAGTMAVGKVHRHVSGTTAQVFFQSDALSNR